jgi:hypothetical protein
VLLSDGSDGFTLPGVVRNRFPGGSGLP